MGMSALELVADEIKSKTERRGKMVKKKGKARRNFSILAALGEGRRVGEEEKGDRHAFSATKGSS